MRLFCYQLFFSSFLDKILGILPLQFQPRCIQSKLNTTSHLNYCLQIQLWDLYSHCSNHYMQWLELFRRNLAYRIWLVNGIIRLHYTNSKMLENQALYRFWYRRMMSFKIWSVRVIMLLLESIIHFLGLLSG